MKTDIQIARECQLEHISEIASRMGIPTEEIEPYGRYMAKVPINLIDEKKVKKSRLILVTAISPTKAGIGKTTVSIGLTLGLNKIGKKAAVALREPSLGPCFGMKGGAAGGGYSQVLFCPWRRSTSTSRAISMPSPLPTTPSVPCSTTTSTSTARMASRCARFTGNACSMSTTVPCVMW